MRFASIRIVTSDVDRLARFYEDVTGVAPLRLAPVFAQFELPGGAIAIGAVETVAMLGAAAPQPASNASVIVEFEVEDVDAEFARVSPADVVLEPTVMPWGNRSALFRDPDGNLVNLFSRPA